jgi:pantothenate kinase
LNLLQKIREYGFAKVPSFGHKVGDPIEDDISIQPEHELVILEGNYVFMDEDVWRDIGRLCDERWLVDVDLDRAMERVVRRHMGTGLAEDAARYRVESNDRPNGEEIVRKSRESATKIIASVDDEAFHE